jgi:hypothetical protein
MSDRLRIGVGLVVVAAAVVLFIVLHGGGGSNDSGGKQLTVDGKAVSGVATIRLRAGKPVGGVEQFQIDSGGRIRFRVTSDIAGEVHVHGYDFLKPIKAGGSVSFDFPAKLEGGFEVELHHGGGEDTIADLKVEPS